MTPLIIDKTQDTPSIILDKKSGKFEFEGTATPENTPLFFAPVKKWLHNYIKNPNQTTRVDFKMDYFNSSVSKALLDILEIFEQLTPKNDLIINWYFPDEDENMFIAGEEYADMVGLKFNFLKR